MTNTFKLRQIILLTLLALSCFVFSGCRKVDEIEIFPPIVFKPVPGEIGGGPVNDNLIVTTVEKTTGRAIRNAKVFVHQGEPLELVAESETDAEGTVSFAGQEITGPVTVTITCNQTIAYNTLSFVNVNAAKIVAPLERRKSPDKVNTALTFVGLGILDEKLSISRNEHTFPDIELDGGNLPEDPWITSVDNVPLAFSALTLDAGGNTTKFGFTVAPDGPIPPETPAMINLLPVSTQNVKIVRGNIQNPPANLDQPSAGWDPHKFYIFHSLGDAGQAGNVAAGFANVDVGYGFQTFVVETPGLDIHKLQVSAFNRQDAHGEMTTTCKTFRFENTPENFDVSFMNVPKQLQIDTDSDSIYPDLVWYSPEGNYTQVDIFHADYNYRWTLYVAGDDVNRMVIPPLEPGSEGALVSGELYRFRVTAWDVPGLNPDNMTFQELREKTVHRARSALTRFMITER
jgi:hypothetical protein